MSRVRFSGPVVADADQWQVLEEQNLGTTPVTVTQNVWSLAYQDALVLRDRTGERLFVQQDANYNTTAMTKVMASLSAMECMALKPSQLDWVDETTARDGPARFAVDAVPMIGCSLNARCIAL